MNGEEMLIKEWKKEKKYIHVDDSLNYKMSHKPITQEEPMGCGVACVASLLGISYKKTLKLFGRNYNLKKGAYCDDIVKTLKKAGLNYNYSKVNGKTKKYINKIGSIIFISPTKKYRIGHYLLKTENGWMNPWVNLPKNPIKAGLQKKLPGKPQWIIYRNSNL
ncbi:hypothetical protein HYT25_01880 [Candidatus Pacearchaeota archaeon]|nr:hypothetical protein [Candidatus Pacearchaeota archaeon]